MEFFNKLKRRLKIKNFMWALVFLVLACLMVFVACQNGFSSEANWVVGVRGSSGGIPVADWVVSVGLLLAGGLFFFLDFFFVRSLLCDTEFNKMMQAVARIGDPGAIGDMLTAMPKSPYAKGDLRYNAYLIYYAKGANAEVVAPASIHGIKSEFDGNKACYVSVYHRGGILKIKSSKKKVLPLLEQLRGAYTGGQ